MTEPRPDEAPAFMGVVPDGGRYYVSRWGSRFAVIDVLDDTRHSTHEVVWRAQKAADQANANYARKKQRMTASSNIWDELKLDTRPTEWDRIERDRFDRPYIVQPDGKRKTYRRTTTFVGCLEDTYKISEWSQRHVAYGLAQRPDLLMAVQSNLPGDDGESRDGKDAVNDLCKQAKEAAGSSSKATIGTALHKITDRLDRGEKLYIPDNIRADVEAYQAATRGLEWNHIERMTVHDDLQVAGTPDRVFTYQGKRYIGDLKTGSLDFGLAKIEMQLALYSRSQLYDIPTGERIDLGVEQDRAAVFHLPAGSGACRLLWVDIEAGWQDVQLAVKVWEQRSRKPRPIPFTVEQASAADVLGSLIASARDADALAALWRQHKADWTPAHSERARQRKAALAGVAA